MYRYRYVDHAEGCRFKSQVHLKVKTHRPGVGLLMQFYRKKRSLTAWMALGWARATG